MRILDTARGWGDIAGYIYRIDGGEDDDSYHIPIMNSCHFLQAAKRSTCGRFHPSKLLEQQSYTIYRYIPYIIYIHVYVPLLYRVCTRITQPGTRPTCSLPGGGLFCNNFSLFWGKPPGVGLYTRSDLGASIRSMKFLVMLATENSLLDFT